MMRWLQEKAWPWLKRYGQALLKIAAGIAAALVVATAYRAIRARVVKPRGFKIVPGDPTAIDIEDGDETVRVTLPRNVTSDNVVVAGISSTGEFAIEIRHAAIDRHGSGGGNESDLDL